MKTTLRQEIDILRFANLLIERYGDTAGLKAAHRAIRLWKQKDFDGALIWRRVVTEIANKRVQKGQRHKPH